MNSLNLSLYRMKRMKWMKQIRGNSPVSEKYVKRLHARRKSITATHWDICLLFFLMRELLGLFTLASELITEFN